MCNRPADEKTMYKKNLKADRGKGLDTKSKHYRAKLQTAYEVAQLKCLLHKHWDMSFIPRKHTKSCQMLGQADSLGSLGHCAASVIQRQSCLNNNGAVLLKNNVQGCVPPFTCVCTHPDTHVYIHTYIHTYCQTYI